MKRGHLQTMRIAFEQICAGEREWTALGNFMNYWYAYAKDRREELVADPLPAYDEQSLYQHRWAVFCADWVKGPPQGQWTYNDYAALPDDGKRYEIVTWTTACSPGQYPRPILEYRSPAAAGADQAPAQSSASGICRAGAPSPPERDQLYRSASDPGVRSIRPGVRAAAGPRSGHDTCFHGYR